MKHQSRVINQHEPQHSSLSLNTLFNYFFKQLSQYLFSRPAYQGRTKNTAHTEITKTVTKCARQKGPCHRSLPQAPRVFLERIYSSFLSILYVPWSRFHPFIPGPLSSLFPPHLVPSPPASPAVVHLDAGLRIGRECLPSISLRGM